MATNYKGPEPTQQQFEARYDSLYRKVPALVHSIDANGRLLNVSDHWLALMGYERDEVIGRRSTDFLTDESHQYAVETVLPEFMRTGACMDVPYQFVKKTGEIVDILLSATAERDANGEIERSYAVLVNVTPQREAEACWRESEQRLQDFLATASDWLWEMDANLRFSFLSQGPRKRVFEIDEALGKTRWELASVAPDCNEKWRDHVADLEARRPFRDFEYQLINSKGGSQHLSISGTPVVDENGEFRGYRGTGRDISQRKQAEKAIEYIALHDGLTGLSNRVSFNRELERASAGALCDGNEITIVLLDIDHFKDINDTLGHAAGDKLLVEVAQRLKSCIHASDILARLGGDEFAMIVSRSYNLYSFEELANRIIGTIGEPICIDGHWVHTGISLGIATGPDNDTTAETMLAHADLALYAAKSGGRKTWRIFKRSMEEQLLAQRSLDDELRRAIKEEQFELHYQPIVDIGSDEVVCIEALLRWHHPERGLTFPDVFIPAMERNRLILPITEWVLREALTQRQRWADQHIGRFQVTVNVSPSSLKSDGFADVVTRCLANAGCDPRRLVIEITESSLLDETIVVPVLETLRALGVSIAVDDFGSGYSSMTRLKSLPVDILKIDRSFLTDQLHDLSIVNSLVNVGTSLRKQVIVEGVERPEQLNYLKDVGCHQAQGFLIAHPMCATDISVWIKEWQRCQDDHRRLVPVRTTHVREQHLANPLS